MTNTHPNHNPETLPNIDAILAREDIAMFESHESFNKRFDSVETLIAAVNEICETLELFGWEYEGSVDAGYELFEERPVRTVRCCHRDPRSKTRIVTAFFNTCPTEPNFVGMVGSITVDDEPSLGALDYFERLRLGEFFALSSDRG